MKPANPKIDAAVADCLEQCNASQMPWKTSAQFIHNLRSSKQWTDAEIIELQTKLVARLLEERGGGKKK